MQYQYGIYATKNNKMGRTEQQLVFRITGQLIIKHTSTRYSARSPNLTQAFQAIQRAELETLE